MLKWLHSADYFNIYFFFFCVKALSFYNGVITWLQKTAPCPYLTKEVIELSVKLNNQWSGAQMYQELSLKVLSTLCRDGEQPLAFLRFQEFRMPSSS